MWFGKKKQEPLSPERRRELNELIDGFKPVTSDEKTRAATLQEAYRKHATELLAIDDAQHKFVLLALAIFSVGVSLLSDKKLEILIGTRIGLTIVAIGIMAVGWHANHELGSLRQDVRRLLVRCELALGFFTDAAFSKTKPLYSEQEYTFPEKGQWHQLTFYIALLAGVGFLVVLWYPVTFAPVAPAASNVAATSAVSLQSNPTNAQLEISSNPAGAEISVDGNFVGDTPSERAAAAGVHTITISKDGYKPWERKLTVSNGKVTVAAKLEQ